MDETQLERLIVSLEANTDKLDKQLVKSSALLDKQFGFMEQRIGTFGTRMERLLDDAGKRTMRSFAANLGPIGDLAMSAGGGLLAFAAAGGAVAFALEQGNVKLAEHQRLLGTVQGVLRATGYATGQTADDIERMAETISESTLSTRNDVLEAGAALATFKGIPPEAFEQTLKLAQDMHQVFGEDMKEAAVQLGRALDDPIRGLTALRRIGVDFSPVQAEMIKHFEETGDHAAAVGRILEAVQGQIGGAGAGAKTGLAGAMHDLDEQWGYFLEDLAKFSDKGGVVAGTIEGIAKAIGFLDEKIKSAGGGLNFLGDLVAAQRGNVASWNQPPPPPAPVADILKGVPATYEDYLAKTGPERARLAAIQENVEGLKEFRQALAASTAEMKKAPLQQAIDKAIGEAAGKLNVTPTQLTSNPAYADEVRQITAAATAHFELQEALKGSSHAAHETKSAAEEAKRAAEEAAKAEEKLAEARHKGWQVVADLESAADSKSGAPGAARAQAVRDAVDKLPVLTANPLSPDFYEQQAQQSAAAQAAGRKFDNESLAEEVGKGEELVRNYRDQAAALGKSSSAAEADKFVHDALAAVYEKVGVVSDDARAKIEAVGKSIQEAGEAAHAAQERLAAANAVIGTFESGIAGVTDAFLQGLSEHGGDARRQMREAAHRLVLDLAENVAKEMVLKPVDQALFGKPGEPGGLLGGGIAKLFGAGDDDRGSSPANPMYVADVTGGAAAALSGGAGAGGGLFSGLGNLFGSTPYGLPSAGPGQGFGVPPLMSAEDTGASSGGGFFSWLGGLFSFAEGSGGKVPGAGSSKGDGLLARLSPGERVMRADTQAKYGPLLDLMDAGHPLPAIPGFAAGSMPALRVPQLAPIRAQPAQLHMPVAFHIDARGAQKGVAEQIDEKLRDAFPAFVGESLRQMNATFPYTLANTLADRF